MNLFLTLGLIFALGISGGLLLEKIKVPKIVWYLVLGLLLGPSVLNLADPGLLEVSSILRQIALVIILTRSGLSLDFGALRKIGRPAILLCFLPACLEMAGIALFAPMILPISFPEALLLGSVLTAVAATAPADAWTVGDYGIGTLGATQTLILHWNGTTWSQVASPNPGPSGSQNNLLAMAVSSATQAWAVGSYQRIAEGS
ncbi:MAG: cation:proton antiporter, partial [Candidatus Enteromonas sp.]